MKYFKKIKTIIEAKTPKQQEDDEIRLKQKELKDQEGENATRNRIKPDGSSGDRQDRAPVNPDGSPVSLDDIQDRKPDTPIDNIGGTGSSMWGVGTHGSEKKPGLFNNLMRGAGHIKSIGDVMDKGAAMLPVKGDVYEDESGKLRKFGKISTGHAAGNPYYFEFDHFDPASKQNLVLYGVAPGRRSANSSLQPITLKVKAIVPNTKHDVSPMTAPTDDNVQSNFVSEDSQAVKDAKRNKQVNIPRNLWHRPEIQRMIDNYKNLNRISLKVRVGGVYGLMVPKDPGDGDSMQKITRKIPRTHIPKIFLDDDFVAEVERVYNIPQDIPAKQAVAAIGLNAVSTGSLTVSTSPKQAMNHVGETLGIPSQTTQSSQQALPQSGDKESQLDIQDAEIISQSDGETVEYSDGTLRYASGNTLGKKPGTIVPGSASLNPAGNNQHTDKLKQITKSILDYTPGDTSSTTPVQSPLDLNRAPTPSPTYTGKSPLDLEEHSINRINQLITGQIDEENSPQSIGSIINRAIAKGEKSTRQILSTMKGHIDDAIAAYEKEYNEPLDKNTKKEVKQTIGLWANKVKKKAGKLKRVKDWWTSGLHGNTQAAPDNNIKGDPAGASYDEPDAVFVGSEPASVSKSPITSPEVSSEPAPEVSSEPTPEAEPENTPLPSAGNLSDNQLKEYVMQLVEGYRKFTLPKPTPKQMIHGNEPSYTKKLDEGLNGSRGMAHNSFLHFAGWNFWPDLTYSDIVSMSLDSTYQGQAFTTTPDNIADHMNKLPSQVYSKDDRSTKPTHLPAAKHGAHIRKVLGQYYNVNTWKEVVSSYLTWVDMSDHPDILYNPEYAGGTRAFSQPKSSDNPTDAWYKDKWKPPKAMSDSDSVLQYLAHDIYTRYKVNILSPSYKFKLQHFKEDEEPDPMEPGYEVKPNNNHHKPTPSTSGAKRGKFFSGPAPKPGQFGSDLPTTTPTVPAETDKEKRDRRKRRGRKRLEESFDTIRKLVIGN